MQWNGHLRTKLPRRRKAKHHEPRPVRGIVREIGFRGVKHDSTDGGHEQCHLAFPTKVAPMMRHCGPFGFGGMMEPWRLHFL